MEQQGKNILADRTRSRNRTRSNYIGKQYGSIGQKHKLKNISDYGFINEKTFLLIFNDKVMECGSENKCMEMLDKLVWQYNNATGKDYCWSDFTKRGKAVVRLLDREDLRLRADELRDWLEQGKSLVGRELEAGD